MSSQLHQTLLRFGRPAYVKAASEQPYREPVGYPTRSREDTYLSWCRALQDGAGADVTQKIAEAGTFWGIKEDLDHAAKVWKTANETRQPTDDEYALVQEYRGGKVRKFAAYDAESTVKAAEAFYDHRAKYPYAWRKEAATTLLRKAASYKAVLPAYVDTYLHKAAGFGYPTVESIDAAMGSRLGHVGHKHSETTDKLAEVLGMIADSPVLRYNDELVKTAMQIMDQFDHETGVSRHYGAIPMPEDMIGVTEPELQKMAAEADSKVTLVNGESVDLRDLDPAALAAVDASLSKLGREELRDVLPTLPRPDADLLIRLMA
jgi:hypothetical protein